jgi:3-hydroxyisobutyrate dehydrogenase
MGTLLATHLVDDGHEVTVWNRKAEAAEPLVERGARAAASAAEAVEGAEAVVTVLFGPEAVREVVIDADLPIPSGALWLDVTTVAPTDATAFAGWSDGRSVQFVHAPVVGSLEPARKRALATLLGGSRESVERARGLVVWADPEKVRTLDTPAQAAAGKLIANLALGVAMQAIVEALRLGGSNGMSTDQVLAALELTTVAPLVGMKGHSLRAGSFGDTQFSADLLAKDVRLMVHSSQAPMPAVTAVGESLRRVAVAGHGSDDFAVIAADEVAPAGG